MDPDVKWTAISPGVMELPTTKFRITYRNGLFTLAWNGEGGLNYGSLQAAKDGAMMRMGELIEMGIEV